MFMHIGGMMTSWISDAIEDYCVFFLIQAALWVIIFHLSSMMGVVFWAKIHQVHAVWLAIPKSCSKLTVPMFWI